MHMNPDENPQSNPQIDETKTDAQQPAPQISSISNKMPPKTRRFTKKLIIIPVVILAVIAGTTTFFVTKNDTKGGSQKTISSSSQPTQSNVPVRLLQQSKNTSGVALGYVKTSKKSTSSNSSPFFKKVLADTINYTPTIFYTSENNSAKQIMALDTVTKETRSLTSAGAISASDPVFSSISQKLAYARSGKTELNVLNLDDNKETIIEPAKGSIQYTPIAWSPDGTKLAYIAIDQEMNTPNWGLAKLYIYQEGVDNQEIKAPEGFNSVNSFADVIWSDTNTITGRYIDKGDFGKTLKEQLFNVDVISYKLSTTNSPITGPLTSVQTASDLDYFINSDPIILKKVSTTNKTDSSSIIGTEQLGSYLLRFNEQDELSDIIYILGEPGSENSMTINSLTAKETQKSVLLTPPGISSYLLGWGTSYDELIYMVITHNTSEIHSLDLTSNTDALIVGDLPMIQ